MFFPDMRQYGYLCAIIHQCNEIIKVLNDTFIEINLKKLIKENAMLQEENKNLNDKFNLLVSSIELKSDYIDQKK